MDNAIGFFVGSPQAIQIAIKWTWYKWCVSKCRFFAKHLNRNVRWINKFMECSISQIFVAKLQLMNWPFKLNTMDFKWKKPQNHNHCFWDFFWKKKKFCSTKTETMLQFSLFMQNVKPLVCHQQLWRFERNVIFSMKIPCKLWSNRQQGVQFWIIGSIEIGKSSEMQPASF